LTSLGAWFWPVLLLVIGLAVLVPVFVTRSAEDDETTPVPVSGPGDELG
jgi:hypothetical protein